MAAGSYAFIDVLILDGVRERFAAGDSLAILSPDLERIIWANGAGARLFGQDDVASAADAPSDLPAVARRQIQAAPGFPAIGRDRQLLVRLPHGVYAFLASAVTLPDGEPAILLAAPAGEEPGPVQATQIIGGIAQSGHFVALLGEAGDVLAGSEGFAQLEFPTELLDDLARRSRAAPDRLVKRIVRVGHRELPIGMARIADAPARHLLLVVDETPRAQPAETPATSVEDAPAVSATDVPPPSRQERMPAADAQAEASEDASTATIRAQDTGLAEHPLPSDAAPLAATAIGAEEQRPAESIPADVQAEETPRRETIAEASGSDDTSSGGSVDLDSVRASPPLRFAWKTDASGRFSAISPEFIAIFGPTADIIGQPFSEVASRIGIDKDGEIAALLERRDTWSGRCVEWPLPGSALRVPVDLAALPVYARDRSFEGFRGFGVARFADASEAQPESVPEPPAAEMPAEAEAPAAATDAGKEPATEADDPFRGEVPALKITPQPDRRSSDKIIRLAEHRAQESGLTPVERNAFREIGDRLRRTRGEGADDRPAEGKSAGTEQSATPTSAPQAEESQPQPARGEHASGSARKPRVVTAVTKASGEDHGEARETAAKPTDTTPSGGDPEAPAAAAVGKPDAAPAGPTMDNTPPALGEGVVDELTETTSRARSGGTGEVAILSRLPVPILISAGDRLYYANEEFLSLTGYASLDDIRAAGGLGSLFADRYDDDSTDDGDHALRLRTATGEEFPIDALLRSVPWNGGHALMLVVRRAGEPPEPPPERDERAEMRAHIAELRAIIDTATDGVIVIAKDGSIRSISRPAEALFGYDNDEISGKQFTSLFAIESQRAARDYLSSLSDHGVASVLNDGREVIGREAQGRFIPLFLSMGRLPNDSGYCAVVRDITPWKRAEEELTKARALAERASSQKSEFLARISHEIRTPLNAIIGFSELMVDERFGPIGNDRYRDYLRDINRSGNHVLDLVNDLLDLSKIEAGEQEMTYEAVSLNETLSQTVAMMQPQANRERVIIRSSFASHLPDVVADLRSVRQIALNLLSNAVRYTQAGGQVIVSTAYEPSGDVVMRVRDTGIGMTVAEIEQAMKPFKQISTLRGTRSDGTGLGLPLTKAMVEANRARFTITSTLGEGTLVEVTFPATRVLAE